jgi:hypothetical protein
MKALRVTANERQAVLERDRFTCVRCGFWDPTGDELQVDHVRPKAEWGPAMDLSEYQTLCARLGGGGCHRDKSAIEAGERAAQRRGGGPVAQSRNGATKPAAKPGGGKSAARKPGLIYTTTVNLVGLLLLIGGVLFVLRWSADNGLVDRSLYESVIRVVAIAGWLVGGLVTFGAVGFGGLLLRRFNRSRLTAHEDRLNATLAKVFGYSTGVRSVRLHRRDSTGPVEWTVAYPPTTADEDPGWAPRMVEATTARVGFPVVLVSLDVLTDEIRMRRALPGERAAAAPGGASETPARGGGEVTQRIVDGAVAELKVKDKERARVAVNVVAWTADGDPAKFTLRYPSGVATHKGDMRADLEDKIADLFPRVRWGARWDTGADVVAFWDLGPDPLTTPVLPAPLATPEDAAADPVEWLTNVVLGQREDGAAWTLRLWQNHVLIAGATGAGKGSVLWSIVRHLLPLRVAGLVKLIGFDPKGGMEFGKGESLFDIYVDRRAQMLPRLRALVDDMELRQTAVKASGERLNTPSKERPHMVVFIDELAFLSAYLTDSKERAEAQSLLAQLLTQGRAPGLTVVGALQDPAKDVIPLRQLFPTRIGLRLDEASQVNMALGEQARRRGARCNQIPANLQGVGYAYVEDSDDPANGTVVRGRAGYVRDPDIDAMVLWSQEQAQRLAAVEAAAAPIPAGRLAVDDRVLIEHGGELVPVTVVEASSVDGRTSVDYVTDAGEMGVIEVEDWEEFPRA